MKICFLSIDVEKKEETSSFEGVKRLDNILNIFKKHRAAATLFVTGEALNAYPDLFKNWAKDFEIGCHSYVHICLDRININEFEKQIKDFVDLYEKIFQQKPKGFRAPRNVIQNAHLEILEKYGFAYDASVLPGYPLKLRHYAGYRGEAPQEPYWPDKRDYRKKGEIKILEIPQSTLAFDFPLVGTWLRKLGVKFFKALFIFKNPHFISFSMHSWDGVRFDGKGSYGSGEKYLKQLDEMLKYLRKIGYEFRSGEEIYNEIQKSKFKIDE